MDSNPMSCIANLGKIVAVLACALLLASPAVAAPAEDTPFNYNAFKCGTLTEDSQTHILGEATPQTCTADSDGDGVSDPEEIVLELNPRVDSRVADSDDDGLSNLYEVKTGLDPKKKNEGEVDYDGDGIPDRTELKHGLDPYKDSTIGKDSDSDYLPDEVERKLGTDPLSVDTDGDGFHDYAEVTETKKLPNADPLHKDIYFEVDEMKGKHLGDHEKREAKALFERVNISNPDGENGITAHFITDDRIPHKSHIHFSDEGYEMTRKHRDYEDRGYHHILVVDSVSSDNGVSDPAGVASYDEDFTAIDATKDNPQFPIVHETGHLLGLGSRDFDGIDSEKYSFDEYPSIMNYNSDRIEENPDSTQVFSDGSAGPNDHNDLAVIRDELEATSAPAVNNGKDD